MIKIEEFINREVIYNQTVLVNDLLNTMSLGGNGLASAFSYDNIENAYPELLEGEAGAEFLEYAEKNVAKYTEDGMPNLERAFREWSFDTMQGQLNHYKKLEKNGNRNTGVIDSSQGGAKEVKAEKVRKTYKDFKVTDPDIAKYFNE